MDEMPNSVEGLAKHLVSLIRSKSCKSSIEVSAGGTIIFDGKRIFVDDLFRILKLEEPSRRSEIVDKYISLILPRGEDNEIYPFEAVCSKIMPKIYPYSVLRQRSPDAITHQPFVNETAIVPVIDFPDSTRSISPLEVRLWGKSVDEIGEIARKNLSDYKEDFEISIGEFKGGGIFVAFDANDGYDSSRILLPDFHKRLSPILGREFYVSIPCRDFLVAIPGNKPHMISLVKARLKMEYETRPCPITPELFLVTQDGVAGTLDKED